MKLESWEPDLRTLLAREEEGDLDLQPDFQRGLAWNTAKQQRLIDTILRGWSIPALHILVLPDEKLAILDGQQRLRSIKLFINNELRVGSFQPFDPNIQAYKGKFFGELPVEVRRKIQNYKLSCYRMYEYEPDEPHELFFRLNLPTGLTQAEKRNALVGDSRHQVKRLVAQAKNLGWRTETIGFANARLAYDDSIARTCSYVESRSLRIPLTSLDLESQYRREGGFSDQTIEVVEAAITSVSEAISSPHGDYRLNKATLITWLLVHCRAKLDPVLQYVNLNELLVIIERGRVSARKLSDAVPDLPFHAPREVISQYLDLYNDRASLRVTDVLSVLARDAVIWRLAAMYDSSALQSQSVARLSTELERIEFDAQKLDWRVLSLLGDPELWGTLP